MRGLAEFSAHICTRKLHEQFVFSSPPHLRLAESGSSENRRYKSQENKNAQSKPLYLFFTLQRGLTCQPRPFASSPNWVLPKVIADPEQAKSLQSQALSAFIRVHLWLFSSSAPARHTSHMHQEPPRTVRFFAATRPSGRRKMHNQSHFIFSLCPNLDSPAPGPPPPIRVHSRPSVPPSETPAQ